ncbi:MAG TPA: hypothetical protein VGM44_14460 [Polyangiaceae bacterium]|jgi:hypothetical protein
MRFLGLAASLLLASLCAVHAAVAQTAGATAGTDATTTPASAALPLVLSLGDAKLDPEAIRRAIELELKRPIALSASAPSAPSLDVTLNADHTVSIAYHAESGVTRSRSRSIALPRDDARAPELIALLSGNLARDEAAELLAGLAAKTPAATPNEGANPPAKPAQPAPKTDAPGNPQPKSNAETGAAKLAKEPLPNELLRKNYPLFALTLFHPLSTFPESDRFVMNGEFGLVYSRVGAIDGVGFNVMVLNTEQHVRGVSFASFYNRAGGDLNGINASGLVNVGVGVRGGSVAGIADFAQDLHGFQLAGVLNRARAVDGLQVAGVTNIAEQIRGMQIGVVNVAGDVDGMQVGVINVARRVHGTSIGLVSIAGNGRVQPVIWGSTFMPFNAAAKFTIGLLYTQVGGGYDPSNHSYSYELGLGGHFTAWKLFVEPGVSYSEKHDTERSFSPELVEHVHYRLALGLDLGALSPFVGAAVVERVSPELGVSDAPIIRPEGFAGIAFF